MTKARELGRELARSREITAMHEAEMVMLRDPGAGAVVRDFNASRQLLDVLAARGEEPDARRKEEVTAIEARAQANPLIARFFAAQREVEELLEKVNEEIGAGLTGGVVGRDGEAGECADCPGCT
ncbi:MAG: YlbF family regulator [Peptococcaceae bacterium]|jgi:cell fate (sporulation/competence/biofilm development) regulator YlbF (YheA/YmcA/DUF963 family)|nr:YlbF family regulator [Peptococcaceae bacterium]